MLFFPFEFSYTSFGGVEIFLEYTNMPSFIVMLFQTHTSKFLQSDMVLLKSIDTITPIHSLE